MKLSYNRYANKKRNYKNNFDTQNYSILLSKYNQHTWIMKKNYYTSFLELNNDVNKKLTNTKNNTLFSIISKEGEVKNSLILSKSIKKSYYKPLYGVAPSHKICNKFIIVLFGGKNERTLEPTTIYYNKSIYTLCPKRLIARDKINYDKFFKKNLKESFLDTISMYKTSENFKRLKELLYITNKNNNRLLIPQIDILNNLLKRKPLVINYVGKDKILSDKIVILSRDDKLVYKAKLEFTAQFSLELYNINKTMLLPNFSINNESKQSTRLKNILNWKNLNKLLTDVIEKKKIKFTHEQETFGISNKIIAQSSRLFVQDLNIKLLHTLLKQVKLITLPQPSEFNNSSFKNSTHGSTISPKYEVPDSKIGSTRKNNSIWSTITKKFRQFWVSILKNFEKKPIKNFDQTSLNFGVEKLNEVEVVVNPPQHTRFSFKKRKKKNVISIYKTPIRKTKERIKSSKHIMHIKRCEYYLYKPTNTHSLFLKKIKYTLTHFDKIRYNHLRLIKKQFIKHTLSYYCTVIKLFLNLYQGVFENYTSFFINFKNVDELPTYLTFNFTRNKFFPVIRDYDKNCFFFSSIGILAKRFNKGKSTYKSKQMYLASASLLRKILIYTQINKYFLIIKKIPTYLLEIINTILNPVVKMYKHPFGKIIIDEKKIKNPFNFHMIYYYNNKPYNFMKTKKKHTLKRKITRRVFLKNRVADIK